MFQKILLPVDLADRHEPALEMAARLASPQATVTLLHVIETITEQTAGEESEFYNSLRASAAAFLDRLGKYFHERKIACKPVILFGHRAAETLHHAVETGTELIVLTAPKLDPANLTANWGSQSFKMSVLAQCPVLLVK